MKTRNIIIAILAFALIVPAISFGGTYQLVSVSVDGTSGNGLCYNPTISADGRYIVFTSSANNLVYNDVNGYATDAFLHDLQTGETTLVSENLSGVSADRPSRATSISADGRFVAFQSTATDLVTDITDAETNSYVRDIVTGETFAVYLGEALFYNYSPIISGDGRYMIFSGYSNYEVPYNTGNCIHDFFVVEIETGDIICIEYKGDVVSARMPSISHDGSMVAFEISSNQRGYTFRDVFLTDLSTGHVRRISKGGEGNGPVHNNQHPSISADGSTVGYASSFADNSGDLIIRDTHSGKTENIGQGSNPVFSSDGRYVAYWYTNLYGQGLYVYDRLTGIKEFITNRISGTYAMSGDGRYIAITTIDSLVPADDNGMLDVYLYDRGPQ